MTGDWYPFTVGWIQEEEVMGWREGTGGKIEVSSAIIIIYNYNLYT